MTRCKVGDVVVVIRTHPDLTMYLGRICTVVGVVNSRVEWLLDMFHRDGRQVCAHDSLLRPIRDQPGEDETLRIAGKPAETPFDVIEVAAR